jgi:hypothetical protein
MRKTGIQQMSGVSHKRRRSIIRTPYDPNDVLQLGLEIPDCSGRSETCFEQSILLINLCRLSAAADARRLDRNMSQPLPTIAESGSLFSSYSPRLSKSRQENKPLSLGDRISIRNPAIARNECF